jgi:hypothetical protein
MWKPILSNWCNNINWDFIFNILSVSLIWNFSCLNSFLVCFLGLHDCFIFFFLISRYYIVVINDIKLSTSVVYILILNISCIWINIEAFGTLCKVSSYSMTDWEIMPLRRNRCCQCSTERVDYRWISTKSFSRLLEAQSH